MLYTREQLQGLTDEEGVIAIQRYLHKIHKKEGRKLFPHECEYIALRLRSIFKFIDGKRTFELALDPYDQPFLDDAIFKYLILIYFENLDFLRPVFKGADELTKAEVDRDKQKFNDLLDGWRLRLHGKKR